MAGLALLLTFIITLIALYPERLGKWLAKVRSGYVSAIRSQDTP